MLITPRTYQQLETQKRGAKLVDYAWTVSPRQVEEATRMLLVHQVGSVRIGEVVRYTITYKPSLDRFLPSPTHLHVKIRNTSAIPLRAAYLVGPFTLYTASYPATFDPNIKSETTEQDGAPDFEPNLKAGGIWTSRFAVPEKVRATAGGGGAGSKESLQSVTWVIDISSQVIFSMSATVSFELLVGRDEKSVELGFAGMGSKSGASPGKVEDHIPRKVSQGRKQSMSLPKGVFSSAVGLVVENTDTLWNKPAFPTWDQQAITKQSTKIMEQSTQSNTSMLTKQKSLEVPQTTAKGPADTQRKQKKVHLVVLTHGLHSNLGADMLYLKESIDSSAEQARRDAQERKKKRKKDSMKNGPSMNNPPAKAVRDQEETSKASESAHDTEAVESEHEDNNEAEDSDEEEVIVRGFSGNACRTERGIQYLGKRLAKWVLTTTYPDQDYLPEKPSVKKKLSRVFTSDQSSNSQAVKHPHNHSSIYHPTSKPERKAYRITSISFVGHSLGGLTQAYAIAYIHKHSPDFFNKIKPINFVAMAAPFLGLSNENPVYVRFALDFGLVGRTGQDLGLSWRAPTMVRSGWEAMIGGIGNEGQRAQKEPDPGSKPLLRILPTGHTHQVLKQFRNRTVYSNVVNDGIVPLRTSCLLFLDWSGLGRVEKARRENGLIGTTLGWGWAELTGVNSSSRNQSRVRQDSEAWSQSDISGDEGSRATRKPDDSGEVPQPTQNAVTEDTTAQEKKALRSRSADTRASNSRDRSGNTSPGRRSSVHQQLTSPIAGLMSFLRPNAQKYQQQSPKQTKIYKRSQTNRMDVDGNISPATNTPNISRSPSPHQNPGLARGDSFLEDPENVFAPPKTSIFESAGDILNPPLPSKEFLIDPSHRPVTIFHDRVYHPEDIPAPPTRRPRRLSRSLSGDSRQGISAASTTDEDRKGGSSDMKVEEKIARAYHHGLTWRKVLVRLEPDAHNNMVVRRMFANAYGWPVVKHLVDTHFADTFEANTADALEPNEENADNIDEEEAIDVKTPTGNIKTEIHRTDSEMREAVDSVADLRKPREANSKSSSLSHNFSTLSREDSARWDDALLEDTEDSEDESGDHEHHQQRPFISLSTDPDSPKGTSEAEIAEFLTRSPLTHESPTSSKDKAPGQPSGGTTTVGLAKSVDEHLALGSPTKAKKSGS